MAGKRKGRPSVKPQPASLVVDQLFRSLKLDEPARGYRACKAFQRAAGARILQSARAERMKGAILYVRVSSSAWAQNLSLMREQIVAKLQRTPGGEGVNDLRFHVGPIEELPDWEAPVAAPGAPCVTGGPPTLDEELRRAIAQVKDDELRAELTRLLSPDDRGSPA